MRGSEEGARRRTFEEDFQNTTSLEERVSDEIMINSKGRSHLFIDKATDTFYTTTTSETTNSRLGDTLDVVAKNLAMTLGSTPKIESKNASQRLTTMNAYQDIDAYFPRPFPPFPRPVMLLLRVGWLGVEKCEL
jgi:hypothetical protein